MKYMITTVCEHRWDGPYTWPASYVGRPVEWRKQYCKHCGAIEATLISLVPLPPLENQPCALHSNLEVVSNGHRT